MTCGEGEWKENSGFGVVEVENPKTGKGPRGFEFGVISIKTHREERNRGNLLVSLFLHHPSYILSGTTHGL
jgi:hypothetical protein